MELIKAKLKFSVHTKKLLKWKISGEDPRVSLIEKSGFGWVRTIQDFNLNTELLTAFYSIFCINTCTFLAGSCKYMISFEDVICLTGLNVDGPAISWKEDKNAGEICRKYLGKDPGESFCSGTAVTLKWLFQNFSEVEEDPSEEELKCSARAYILYVLGTFVLPDSSGKNVNALLLPFLEDFDRIKNFAWGAAMLAYLIDSLHARPTEKNNVNVAGNAALLMFWVYERFPQFRPEGFRLESQESRVIPLMGHWTMLIAKDSKNSYAKSRLGDYEILLQSGNLIYSPISNIEFPASLSFLEKQLPLSLAETYIIYGNHHCIYCPTVCRHQFEGLDSCTSTPALRSCFKLKGKKKKRRGPQLNIDWTLENKEVFDIWDGRWANLAGEVQFERGSSCCGEGQISECRDKDEGIGRGEEAVEDQSEVLMGRSLVTEDDHPHRGNERAKSPPVPPREKRRSFRIKNMQQGNSRN